MGRRRRRAAALLATAPLALVAACSDDGEPRPRANGIDWYADTSAPDLLAAAGDAMADVTSLHVVQRARATDRVVGKDLSVSDDGTCDGTIQLPAWGEPAEFVSRDGEAAFRGPRSFWLTFELPGADGGTPDAGESADPTESPTESPSPADPEQDPLLAALADAYADQWVTTDGLDALCDLGEFVDPISRVVGEGADAPDEVTKAGLGDVAGRPVGRVTVPRGDLVVTVWIDVAEPHRVLRLDVASSTGTTPLGEPGDSTTTYSQVDVPVEADLPDEDEVVEFAVPTVD